ncbi:hypothetical protein GGU10DRAFT_381006 [Lentinula aff. detonsa]|uniref:Uncharacterized protein n=1 Tax=Lentinula aff. detonsa TaxID=2804958 RepID=A0AA38NN53_9AGAR|nr:hypothetical protein GGU10DRAFT_381006 [Lentinula aff. detonsa]
MPHWVTSSLPFLGFAPSSNPFKFHFLKCLDYALHTLPIERVGHNRYMLKKSLQTDWDSLERNMRAFLSVCMKVNQLNIPEDFWLWLYPNFYMYHGLWNTKLEAHRAAMRSRHAFLPLIACISFYLHLLYHLENKWVDVVGQALRVPWQEPSTFLSKRQQKYERLRQEPAPLKWEWQQRLQKEMSISPEWLAYFHQIMDIPMVGTYLDVHNSGCFPWLPIFLEAKMPLMLFWGTINHWSIPKRLTFLLPTPETAMFPIPSAAGSAPWLRFKSLGHHLYHLWRRIFLTRQDLQKLECDFLISLEVFHVPMKIYSHLSSAEMSAGSKPLHLRPCYNTSLTYSVKTMLEEIDLRVEKVLASTIGTCPDFDDFDTDNDYDAYFLPIGSEMNEEGDHNIGAASLDAFLVHLHHPKDLLSASIQFLETIEDIAYHWFGFLKNTMQDGRELSISTKIWQKTLGLLGYGQPSDGLYPIPPSSLD